MGKSRTFFVHVGQRFGRLVVAEEERLRHRPGRPSLWEAVCDCDCGKRVTVLLQGLKKGTQSCGCAKQKGTMTKRFRETRGAPRLHSVSPDDQFDRLTVMREVQLSRIGESPLWVAECACVCGGHATVRVHNLKSGITRSCGCLQREHASRIAKSQSTHGLTDHPNYSRWSNIRSRCDKPKDDHYKYYGGRGIRMCEEWYDVVVFITYLDSELGPCPTGWSLDRIDNNGNYEPGNVRWADSVTQRHNQRRGTSNSRGKSPDITD